MHRKVITIYVRSCNPTHISLAEKGRCGTENHCFQTGRDLATECSHLDPENILVPVTLLRLSTAWFSVHDIYSDLFNGDQGAEARGTQLQNKDPRVLYASIYTRNRNDCSPGSYQYEAEIP